MKVVENKVFNNWMCLLRDGKGIHAKLRGWKKGHPDREPAFMWVFRNELKPGMVFYDIGANVGYQTLIGAEILNGNGSVVAFEPDPRNAKLLQMSINKNGYKNIEVKQVVVSDSYGETSFHLSDATNLSSVIKTKHSKEEVKIKTIVLECDQPLILPNFIKMDVEGHEVEVIRGAINMFAENNFACKILIEVHPRTYSKERSLETELRKLLALGFNTKYVISAAVAIPDLFKEKKYTPVKVFQAGQYYRGVYNNVSNDNMLELACYCHEQVVPNGEISDKIVRAIMLERKEVTDVDEDKNETSKPRKSKTQKEKDIKEAAKNTMLDSEKNKSIVTK